MHGNPDRQPRSPDDDSGGGLLLAIVGVLFAAWAFAHVMAWATGGIGR